MNERISVGDEVHVQFLGSPVSIVCTVVQMGFSADDYWIFKNAHSIWYVKDFSWIKKQK